MATTRTKRISSAPSSNITIRLLDQSTNDWNYHTWIYWAESWQLDCFRVVASNAELGLTVRVPSAPAASITARVGEHPTGAHTTSRLSFLLALEGDLEGVLALEGDAVDSDDMDDALKLEGDVLNITANHTRRVATPLAA